MCIKQWCLVLCFPYTQLLVNTWKLQLATLRSDYGITYECFNLINALQWLLIMITFLVLFWLLWWCKQWLLQIINLFFVQKVLQRQNWTILLWNEQSVHVFVWFLHTSIFKVLVNFLFVSTKPYWLHFDHLWRSASVWLLRV